MDEGMRDGLGLGAAEPPATGWLPPDPATTTLVPDLPAPVALVVGEPTTAEATVPSLSPATPPASSTWAPAPAAAASAAPVTAKRRRWPWIAAIVALLGLLGGSVAMWQSASSTADDNRALADQRLAEIKDRDAQLEAAAKDATDLQTQLDAAAAAAKKADVALTTAQAQRDAAQEEANQLVRPMSAIEVKGHAKILLDIWAEWKTKTTWTVADLTATESTVDSELDILGPSGAADEDADCVATLSVAFGDLKAILVPLYGVAATNVAVPEQIQTIIDSRSTRLASAIPAICGL